MRRLLVAALLIAACSPSEQAEEPSTTTESVPATSAPTEGTGTTAPAPFSISSPAFEDGAAIPPEYTCVGEDVSPELAITGVPASAAGLVLIVDDPDAPTGVWDHWVEFDISPEPASRTIPRDTGPIGTQGVNSWHLPGYMGPCPPADQEHTYVFTLYAVDARLDLPDGVDSDRVRSAMEGHVITSVELTGVFGR